MTNEKVSDAPGLGIAIDREKLWRFEQPDYASPSWTWEERKEFEVP